MRVLSASSNRPLTAEWLGIPREQSSTTSATATIIFKLGVNYLFVSHYLADACIPQKALRGNSGEIRKRNSNCSIKRNAIVLLSISVRRGMGMYLYWWLWPGRVSFQRGGLLLPGNKQQNRLKTKVWTRGGGGGDKKGFFCKWCSQSASFFFSHM